MNEHYFFEILMTAFTFIRIAFLSKYTSAMEKNHESDSFIDTSFFFIDY
jgi:hypothetical protein